MIEVSVYAAKAKLSALLQEVARGREVVITNRNRPAARLVACEAPRRRPVFGAARGAMKRAGLTDADVRAALAGEAER